MIVWWVFVKFNSYVLVADSLPTACMHELIVTELRRWVWQASDSCYAIIL